MYQHEGYEAVPAEVLDKLDDYGRHRRSPGGFLSAVLANDLRSACAKADGRNIVVLREIVLYINWQLPHECHGSHRAVIEWLEDRT